MITLEQYRYVHEMMKTGVPVSKIAEKLGWSKQKTAYWTRQSEEHFLYSLGIHGGPFDTCRQFLVDAIRLCPEVSTANLMLKVSEAYPEIPLAKNNFYAYVKNLREEINVQKPGKRITSLKAEGEPGYEAQVDFGSYRMKNMYGLNVKVYFFTMELSYSRMRFYWFSTQPFTTKLAIEAHNYAFLYFGGRPKTVMYDQDKLFVVSENYGEVIFVKEFEDYVRKTGYSIYLCRPRDPQTKGKIESSVNFVKRSFLDGRIFYGIDRLNTECMHWMDNVCNLKVNAVTHQRPRDMFETEIKALVPYKPVKTDNLLRRIEGGHVNFRGNRYEVTWAAAYDNILIRVEPRDGKIYLFDAETDELLYTHREPKTKGHVVKIVERTQKISAAESAFDMNFKGNFYAEYFKQRVKAQIPRYAYTQFMRMNSLLKQFGEEELTEALKYCIHSDTFNVGTVIGFLIVRHPEADISEIVPRGTKKYYLELAERIGEDLHE